MKIYDLPVMGYDRAKSFYGKAKVIEKDNGEFVRLWDGYSVTTMRHVNSFLSFFGISGGGKSWWDSQPVEETRRYSMAADMTPAESLKYMYARRAANNMNY